MDLSLHHPQTEEDSLRKTFIINSINSAKEHFLSNNVQLILQLATVYLTSNQHTAITDRLTEALLRELMDTTLKIQLNQVSQLDPLSVLDMVGYSPQLRSVHNAPLQKVTHELSQSFGLSKTAALSIAWPTWARSIYRDQLDRFALFAENVLAVDPSSCQKETALKGIHAVEHFFHVLHLPTSLEDLDICLTDVEFDRLIQKIANPEIQALLKCCRS